MSGQVSRILEPLTQAIDRLDLPVDNTVLADAFALADRLHAKLVAAVGEHDMAELWRSDGATSMTAWLRHHGPLAADLRWSGIHRIGDDRSAPTTACQPDELARAVADTKRRQVHPRLKS
jgi:hypothetical protein